VLGGLAIAVVVLARSFDFQGVLRDALAWIRDLGPLGPVIFVLLYIAASVFLFPAVLLTLGAGAVYGVLWGSVLVSISATLGATAAFLVGRYIAREWVAKRTRGSARFRAVDEAVAREGWKIVGLTRLSPAFPFVLLNYFFGITKVSLRDVFFASMIGMIPAIVMYVYIGSLAGSLASIGGQRNRTSAEWVLYGIGLVATVAVAVFVTRIARRALEQRVGGEPVSG
jgi:uncharacterized membrane protein YdjX (TVP38/TMEM64 family)